MRKMLPVVLVLAGLLLGPAAMTAETVKSSDTGTVKVKGTTEGGMASAARLPGQEPKEKDQGVSAQVGDYFLNRFLDLVDIVDFSIGAGPGFLINVRATKMVQAIGGISDSWRIGFRGRSAGVWREKRRECGISLLYYQKVQRERITGWVESFRADEMDLDTADIYGGDKDRAFTGVGATVHVGILVDVNVRPMQAVDFILGLFTIDVLDDDYGKAVRNKDL
jgi:hypothetical protein